MHTFIWLTDDEHLLSATAIVVMVIIIVKSVCIVASAHVYQALAFLYGALNIEKLELRPIADGYLPT